MKHTMYLLFILNLISFSYCTVYFDSPCPNVKPVEDFDLNKFAQGTWYEIAKYPNEWEINEDCVSMEYPGTEDKSFRIIGSVMGKANEIDGYMDVKLTAGTKGVIVFRSKSFTGETFVPTYVLGIDYNKFVILYECRYDEKTKRRHDFVWINSRDKVPDKDTRKIINDFLKTADPVDPKYLLWDQFTNKTCPEKSIK